MLDTPICESSSPVQVVTPILSTGTFPSNVMRLVVSPAAHHGETPVDRPHVSGRKSAHDRATLHVRLSSTVEADPADWSGRHNSGWRSSGGPAEAQQGLHNISVPLGRRFAQRGMVFRSIGVPALRLPARARPAATRASTASDMDRAFGPAQPLRSALSCM